MTHLLAAMGDAPFQPLHPLRYWGYEFWSGIAGSFLTSIPGWTVAILVFWRLHNCHIHRCWRLSWHPDPDSGHPVCRHHHPEHP